MMVLDYKDLKGFISHAHFVHKQFWSIKVRSECTRLWTFGLNFMNCINQINDFVVTVILSVTSTRCSFTVLSHTCLVWVLHAVLCDEKLSINEHVGSTN